MLLLKAKVLYQSCMENWRLPKSRFGLRFKKDPLCKTKSPWRHPGPQLLTSDGKCAPCPGLRGIRCCPWPTTSQDISGSVLQDGRHLKSQWMPGICGIPPSQDQHEQRPRHMARDLQFSYADTCRDMGPHGKARWLRGPPADSAPEWRALAMPGIVKDLVWKEIGSEFHRNPMKICILETWAKLLLWNPTFEVQSPSPSRFLDPFQCLLLFGREIPKLQGAILQDKCPTKLHMGVSNNGGTVKWMV